MAYHNIPLEIRKEYGESLSEVIRGYARMGYSKRATSQAMGITLPALLLWCMRLGLDGCFSRLNYNESCRPLNKEGWPKGKPRHKRKRYSDSDLLALVSLFSTADSLDQADGFPASTTVLRRFGTWNNAKRKAMEEVSA